MNIRSGPIVYLVPMVRQKVTDEDLLAVIVRMSETQGAASLREIGREVGITSSSTIWNRVQRLKERGLVEAGPRVRATGTGAAVSDVRPEILYFDLEVRIDPASADPITVRLVAKE